MYKNYLTKTLLVLIFLTGSFLKLRAQTNIASDATVSTSYVSSWETLEAVKDGIDPSSSTDNSDGAYGNWNGEDNYNTYNYVQYEWTTSQEIASTSVYWWDDNQGIDQPTDAYIQYKSNGSWVTFGNIGITLNQYNTLSLNINTTGLRIYMISEMATGILEWKAFKGTNNGTDDTEAPSTPTNLIAQNITAGSVYLSWDASTDNIGVTGYSIIQNGSIVQKTSGTSITISGLSAVSNYSFSVSAYDASGNVSEESSAVEVTTLESSSGNSFTWPAYNPNILYDFTDEYGDVQMPTNVLDDCSGVVGTQSSEWWTFRWGASANSLVTSAAITPMLERLNTDFAYFRDNMGWPPDSRVLEGYKSAVYLYGSGLCTDDASNTDKGGWQSATYYNGKSWPIILASYYPVYSFDPACTYSDKVAQQGAMVHEGIHCVLASMPGCKNAAWFHEGGNTWLQQEADSRRSGDYSSMGFLNAASMIAPFMPIECYSGWLQDGSFGGPAAEGVDMFEGSQQICTWRKLLGGAQYSNIFPTFLGQALGKGSIAWIWKNCPSRVLEGMAAGLGETQTRRLICEYRAKQAVVDFGEWTDAIVALLDANMNSAIGAEWSPSWMEPDTWYATPYVNTTNNNGVLTPESRTTPGWSGANQVPLTVSGDVVTVNFQPIGENMTCQLCYIATDGTRVYSEIVSSGDCSINLDLAPANNVVIAVVTNTNYIYEGESTRKAHYDYRLEIVEGISGTADVQGKWYQAARLKSASSQRSQNSAYNISNYCNHNLSPGLDHIKFKNSIPTTKGELNAYIYPNPLSQNSFMVEIPGTTNEMKSVEIMNIQGQSLYQNDIKNDKLLINTEGILQQGIYLVIVGTPTSQKTYKLIVE
jgi:chitodextrinase